MKTIKTLFIGLVLLCVLVGVASAETHVPAGSISNYNMNVAGETYILDGDVTATSGAFVVGANNITLDGNSHSVTYATSSTGIGISASSKSNPTIKNIHFVQSNDNINSMDCSFSSVTGGLIKDSTFESVSSAGLLLSSSSNVTVRNCSCISGKSDGISIIGGYGNIFDNCSGTATQITVYSGIHLDTNSLNNTLTSCIGTSFTGTGILLNAGCENNNLTKCKGQSTYWLGFNLSSSNNNTLADCTGISENKRGIKFTESTGNTIKNMTVISPLGSAPHSTNHILCIGDSITEGVVGDSKGYAIYVNQTMQNCTSETWYVSNTGTSGDTSGQGRTRFLEELETYQPQIVTIWFGENDISQGFMQQTTIDNVLWMADTARTQGITPIVVLTTPTASNLAAKVAYDQALKTQAEAQGIQVICAYDCIDSIPYNGNFDNYVAAYTVDGTHPNDTANRLIGSCIGKNIYASTHLCGVGFPHVVTPGGNIINSRDIRSSDDAVQFALTPDKDNVTVNVTEWTEAKKVWVESSETHDTVTQHTIGDFPTNTKVQINVDGVKEAEFTSNETGYITFGYTGYSEHTFEATIIDSDMQKMKSDASGTWSRSVGIVSVVVVIVLSALAISVFRGKKVSMVDARDAVIALMIIMLVITMGYGIFSILDVL